MARCSCSYNQPQLQEIYNEYRYLSVHFDNIAEYYSSALMVIEREREQQQQTNKQMNDESDTKPDQFEGVTAKTRRWYAMISFLKDRYIEETIG